MSLGKGRPKLRWVLGIGTAGLFLIWFACPLWFPWVLRPAASHLGARFGGYTRLGYSHFLLHDLVYTNQSLDLRAHQVDALVPSVWFWRLWFGPPPGSDSYVRVANWDCHLLPSDQPPSPSYSQVLDAAVAIRSINRWFPRADLSNGHVRSQELEFGIPQATWHRGLLEAQVKLPPQVAGQMVDVKLTQERPFELHLSLPAQKVESTVVLTTNRSGFDLSALTIWQSNRVDLQAQFGFDDILPATASLQAREFRVPGELIRLPAYREIDGSLSAQWRNSQFVLDLVAVAYPHVIETNLPPVHCVLQARGDTSSATIQKLNVQLPFLEAQLSNQLTISLSAPFLRGPAALGITADLGRQPWMALEGKLVGRVEVMPGPESYPRARLILTGSRIGRAGLVASAADLSLNLAWPLLELSRGRLLFEDGSNADLSGELDLERRSIKAGHFQFTGPLARRWLPPDYSYDNFSISGAVSGPVENPIHSGVVVAGGVVTPVLRPLRLDVQWEGQAGSLQQFEVRLDQTNASLSASGSLAIATAESQLQLTSLDLLTNKLSALKLVEPVTIRFAPPHPGSAWHLDSTSFHLAGPAGDLAAQTSIAWPNTGSVRLSLQHLASELFGQFIRSTLPHVAFTRLEAAANWTNGPASLCLDATGSAVAQPSPDLTPPSRLTIAPSAAASEQAQLLSMPMSFELKLSGDERGLVLSKLAVNTSTAAVVVVSGFLPATLTPASPTNLFQFGSQQELQLSASAWPEAFFWEDVAKLTGVRLLDPMLNLNIAGTWSAPRGKIDFQARSLQFMLTNSFPVNFENLHLSLNLEQKKIQLTEGKVLIQGQPVSLGGELPLGENSWTVLLHKKLPPLEQASGNLRVANAQLAAFDPLFPGLLAPEGSVDVNLELQPGANLAGVIILRQARTRPLGHISPVRDINVTLRFHQRSLSLERATANLSGSEVNLSGRIDFSGTNWLTGSLPPFALKLQGTNVPLAREPAYVIRSDLDLSIAKTNDAPALISGTARLRDSFYLSDVSSLIPGKVATPSSRPPYFSIDNPLLADWRLAVTVEGARWLKLRTSLFNGEVSANLHLQGSLKDPLILGGVTTDSGLVRFPFADLEVKEGMVTLTSQDPYHPQLLVRASSKQFGYDIQMEVTGAADAPVIQFTSNPPLSSEQILLMITAGQLPAGSFTLTPQQRAQTVALFFGRDALAKLGLGDQSEDRLTVKSGEEISEQGRPTYHIEYKLTNRWSVEGEYDRFGDFNAGFKWRVYSK